MMTHDVVHESFKNNISNNTHNIALGAILFSGGENAPSRPLNSILYIYIHIYRGCMYITTQLSVVTIL